ncbi:MAG: hypothetical protein ACJAYQ_002149, partial [Bacteriovoracaceae bacterium]
LPSPFGGGIGRTADEAEQRREVQDGPNSEA